MKISVGDNHCTRTNPGFRAIGRQVVELDMDLDLDLDYRLILSEDGDEDGEVMGFEVSCISFRFGKEGEWVRHVILTSVTC